MEYVEFKYVAVLLFLALIFYETLFVVMVDNCLILLNVALFIVAGGEYWRLLTPGKYQLTAVKNGFIPESHEVVVTNKPNTEAIRQDFELKPDYSEQSDVLFDTMVSGNINFSIYVSD